MMGKILTIILLTISCLSFGQSISIASSKNNILYCGIENPLDVVVENMKCASFFLTTDNGQIKGEKCSYIIIPKKNHQLTIYVKKIIKNDTILIGKKEFRVKKIPLPIASVGSKYCEGIQKNYLIASGGIVARFLNMDFDLTVKIDSFSVLIFREKTPIYKTSVVGNKFSEELIAEFRKLQSNDELIFYNIAFTNQAMGFIGERLEPVDFTIE